MKMGPAATNPDDTVEAALVTALTRAALDLNAELGDPTTDLKKEKAR